MSSKNSTRVPSQDEVPEYTPPNIWIERFKMFYATCVVNFLAAIACICIANRYCILKIHPVGCFILLIFALTWLAYLEGLHYACVALEKRDMSEFEEEFPRAVANHADMNDTAKVKKFLVGRQFFVIFVVFLIAQITSFPDLPSDFGGLPDLMNTIIFQTGLPGVAIVLTYGQLISQLYVEEYCVSFYNLIGCGFVQNVCFAAEYVGVCHFSHLLFRGGSRLFCGSVRKAEKTMTDDNLIERHLQRSESLAANNAEEGKSNNDANALAVQNKVEYVIAEPLEELETTGFDIIRYIWSTAATLFSVTIIMAGIAQEHYVLPTGNVATYFIFFLALTLLFYLEGIMIAIVAVQYYDRESFREAYPRAYMVHELATRPDNVKRFIIGRQFCTVLTNFLLAQATTFEYWEAGNYPAGLFWFCVKSGLVGVLTVLSFGQLMPELLAAQYPLRFLDMYGCYSTLYVSLVFDWIGVGHCAWLVHHTYDHISGNSQRNAVEEGEKPQPKRVISPELLANTGSIIGDYQKAEADGVSVDVTP